MPKQAPKKADLDLILSGEIVPLSTAAPLFKCSVRTVREYIRQGLLPALRRPSGRIVGVPQWAIADFLAAIEK